MTDLPLSGNQKDCGNRKIPVGDLYSVNCSQLFQPSLSVEEDQSNKSKITMGEREREKACIS